LDLNSANKILIIRLSSLGDILLSTPLVRSLKQKYPSVRLDYLVREEYKDTLLLNPYIDNLLLFTNKKTDEIKEKIKNENYDLVIDLQNNLRSAGLLEYFRQSKISYNKRNITKFLLVRFKINFLKKSPPVPVRYAEGIKKFKLDDKGLDLFTNNFPSHLFNGKEKFIGIAPGARHFTKKWPAEYYIELGNKLVSDGYKIALFGGRDDREVCTRISAALHDSFNLSNNNDLLQLSADMRKCSAIICNDSGLMHTAAASGVPVLTIFGSTVKEFGFVPYKIKNRISEHLSLPCRPCTHIGRSACPLDHFKCMREITPEAVYENLKGLLAE
jgi:ADP-heptose:LPS heptosyltransferase